MKIICVYVDAGKGHYIPAKAVQEELAAQGHETELVECFDLLDARFFGRLNKKIWRFLLKVPPFERHFTKHHDQNTAEIHFGNRLMKLMRKRLFRRIMAEKKPDAFFTTHTYPANFLSELAAATGIKVPVFHYASDMFYVPRSSINNKIDYYYVATEEGVESARAAGQQEEGLRLCPFPLQLSCRKTEKLDKATARRRLGLKEDLFTLQVNFGGEGLGSTRLLENLGRIGVPMQVVVIGGMDAERRAHLEHIASKLPSDVEVHVAGFVDNVNEYVLASDIIAGRSGINTLVEAFYLHRPFLMTELVYTVVASAAYAERYHVGWNCDNDLEAQVRILSKYAHDTALLDELDKNFDQIPISYDTTALARMVVDDIKAYKERWNLL